MRRAYILFISIAVAGVVGLSGCTAAGAETVPEATPASAASTDALTCAGINDIRTIIANADVGLRDGRMAAQEQEGWYRLAARVVHRLPSSDESAVSEAVAELQNVVPNEELGSVGSTEIGSAEWYDSFDGLDAACTEAGVEPAVGMFTGG
jgi:hypothetical protein